MDKEGGRDWEERTKGKLLRDVKEEREGGKEEGGKERASRRL